MKERYDVIVVGASLAGSAAATLLARAGARVALVERSPDPAHHKRVCGHFIQASAVPVLERLGVMGELEAAGAVRSHGRLHTPWGWHARYADDAVAHSLNLRRAKLDPIVRGLAARTPGVTLLAGCTVTGLVREGEVIRGVETRDGARLHGRLVVGADGRDSAMAKLAGLPARTTRVERFAYGAYYEGPAPAMAPDGQLWFLDPGWAAAFPTDDGLTQYAVMLGHDRLAEFRSDPAGALERFVAALPDAPPIAESRRVSAPIGKLRMDNVRRGPVAPGLALVGDAASAADPLWGVGCGWALQSAEWLAGAVAGWLGDEISLDRALRRYRRSFERRLRMHLRMIDDYAPQRPFGRMERALHLAATRDPHVAARMARIGTRSRSPLHALAPAGALRVWRANRSVRWGRGGYSSTTSTSPSLTA